MTTLSRTDIEQRIANGDCIVIYENRVLKLNNWILKHPGGDKAIYHMVGRDATDEMNAYHSDQTRKLFKSFTIGTIDLPWKNFLPPIQGGEFRAKDGRVVGLYADRTGLQGIVGKLAVIEPSSVKDVNTRASLDPFESKMLEADLQKYPALDYDTQNHIRERYIALEKKLRDGGFFQCNYWAYAREFTRYTLFGLLAYTFLRIHWYVASAFFLGVMWHQLTFFVHDAGHLAITHNYYIDNIAAVIIADFMGGLSAGWWKRNHNVHHLVTNDPIHDPDIQHLPFFAVSTRLFHNVFSSFYERLLVFDPFAKVMLRAQRYTYYFILSFGRFNLYRLSWEYLLIGLGPRRGKAAFIRYLEITGMLFFTYWFFYLLVGKALPDNKTRFIYIMVSHITTMPVHVQIVLSHFAMSTADLGVDESFPQKQLRTTMDVDCPVWLDFFHGGLQFQAVHHLFPRMPRHNFRSAQKLVKQFCEETGIEYSIYTFTKGNQKVLSHLQEIANQARVLLECSKHYEEEAESGKLHSMI
ncbi:hypothetical protein CANCADRAFT_762 [Tortispora caseinolytica NRRL Y-17796]|uniref:Delta 8-(E)-sphingolipid desaturase n=1 Tax=Tortispora caseinolytica NRRL Y-17796 TaxID=767744 RepID=A0A1E4TK93_9ASCO|nr:hypothetical protein CANCADRAFT_762 [Tortispora caseinolytica NRRL Y-17796]